MAFVNFRYRFVIPLYRVVDARGDMRASIIVPGDIACDRHIGGTIP
jgi:hypothetical protein